MRRIHAEVDRTYGSPRMHQEVRARGYPCGWHRVERLMRAAGIRAKQATRFRVTTDSGHSRPVAPNRLGRAFTVSRPNAVWMGDITYEWTREGWCYLAVLLDAFSRRVMGWALAPRLGTGLPLAAWRQALAHRRPAPGLVHHSDRGTQYASAVYQATLQHHGMVCSMSRVGDCWDNAVVESFFHTLRVDRLRDRHYATRAHALADLEQSSEGFYNRRRRHSTLGYVPPALDELRSSGRSRMPRRTTKSIRRVFSMSRKGSAKSTTKSATAPARRLPRLSAPSQADGVVVAAASVSRGLTPSQGQGWVRTPADIAQGRDPVCQKQRTPRHIGVFGNVRVKVEQTRYDPPPASVNRLAYTVSAAAFSEIDAHNAATLDHDVDVGRGLQILANHYGGTNDGNGIVAAFATPQQLTL